MSKWSFLQSLETHLIIIGNIWKLDEYTFLFWKNYGSAYHVAIYIGNGNFIQAPTSGQSVKITNMNYYRPSFTRRIL